jgi:glycerate dehydrogenase
MQIAILDGSTLNPGDNPWSEIQRLGNVQVFDRTPTDLVVSRSVGASILVINKVRLEADTLSQLSGLRMIAVTATGYDCVDVRAAAECGIAVANVPVYGTDSVAQHVFALLLHVLHRVDLHDQAIRDGEWAKIGAFSFWRSPLTELSGKTMGIVGLGRIGRRVAQLADAFGMSVVACSRRQQERPALDSFRWTDLEGVLGSSDVISLHCPLTDETRGLICSQSLQRIRPHAILINASRGALVVEADLAESLRGGKLLAAALDVVSEEPIRADNPLLNAPRCFLTPHLAWATLEARKRLMAITADNIASFLAGQPKNLVNQPH